MATIPSYYQGSLAQTMVGVPEMPEAGQMLASNELQNTGALMRSSVDAEGQAANMEVNAAQLHAAMQGQATHQAVGQFIQSANQFAGQHAQDQYLEKYYAAIRMRQQQALAAKAQEATNKFAVNNHELAWSMTANDIFTRVANDQSIPAEQKPGMVQDLLISSQKEYLEKNKDQINPNVAMSFIEKTNPTIGTYYNDINRTVGTERAKQEIDRMRSLTGELVQNTTTPMAYDQLSKFLAKDLDGRFINPKWAYQATHAWGRNAATETDKILKDAAENTLWSMARTAPGQVEYLTQSPDFQNVDQHTLGTIAQAAKLRLDGQQKDGELAAKLQEQHDLLQVSNIVDSAKSGSASDYRQGLADGYQQVQQLIAAEYKKPVRQFGDPIVEPVQNTGDPTSDRIGKPIAYQRESVVKFLESRRDKLQADIMKDVSDTHTEQKQVAQDYKNTVQQTISEETRKYNEEGVSPRNSLYNAMGELRAFRISDTNPQAKTPFVANDDMVQSYLHASSAYRSAEEFLDKPGAGTKQSTLMRKELLLIGNKLLNGTVRPDQVQEHTLTMKSLSIINETAPSALHTVLNEYQGRSADAVNTEFIGKKIQAYDDFHRVTGQTPSPAIMQKMSDDIKAKMHGDARWNVAPTPTWKQIKQDMPAKSGFVPPPPPTVPVNMPAAYWEDQVKQLPEDIKERIRAGKL